MAEPGESFRWGLVLRRSQYNKRQAANGEVEHFEHSTRRQELALMERIKRDEMGRVVAVYRDVASAYKEGAKRPEYEAALQDLQSKRIDGIAVWRLDRLVRRSSQYRQVLSILEESGGRLFSMREGIDTYAKDAAARATTRIMLSLLAELAEMEAEATASRMVLMHDDRHRQGLPPRSQVRPFGHTLNWYELVPEEAALLQDAARRIIAGDSRFAIAREWQNNGVPTVMGGRWHGETLKHILDSERMVGKWERGGVAKDMRGVPPILDMETWKRVREAMSGGTPRPGGRAAKRAASGIMACGDCGAPIVGNTEGPHSRETYVCRKRHAYPKACGGVSTLTAHVDEVIAEKVCEFLNDRSRVAKLLRQHAQGAELDALHARQEELNERLVELDDAHFSPPPGVQPLSDERYARQVKGSRPSVRKFSGCSA
jgi:DNA invertase Pin-like site-specific DNA recombinase